MHDEEAEIVRVTIASPEGSRVELHDRLSRHLRPDVAQFFSDGWPAEKHGFVCFFELDAPSIRHGGWILEMENADGTALETQVPAPTEELAAVRAALLDETTRDPVPDERLMAEHVHPAMARIQAKVEKRRQDRDGPELRDAARRPDRLDRRAALPADRPCSSHQLAEFVARPGDQPGRPDLRARLARGRASVLEHVGLATSPDLPRPVPDRGAASRTSASPAPTTPARRSRAAGCCCCSTPTCCPTGPAGSARCATSTTPSPTSARWAPKLLYEDDTIQHAGMYFHQPPGSTMWRDAHYFKGLHRTLPGRQRRSRRARACRAPA